MSLSLVSTVRLSGEQHGHSCEQRRAPTGTLTLPLAQGIGAKGNEEEKEKKKARAVRARTHRFHTRGTHSNFRSMATEHLRGPAAAPFPVLVGGKQRRQQQLQQRSNSVFVTSHWVWLHETKEREKRKEEKKQKTMRYAHPCRRCCLVVMCSTTATTTEGNQKDTVFHTLSVSLTNQK